MATPRLLPFTITIDPANCTIAYRGHGYKYAALYGGNSCRCMGNAPCTAAPLSSTNPLDPVTLNSCHIPGQYLPGNCPGDSSQFCGTGTYADVYGDNSFPLLSTINPVVEESKYGYIGCFHPGSGNDTNVGLLSYLVPAASIAGATSLTPCFEYCASLGFPYVEFDGANNYTSLVIELPFCSLGVGFSSIDASVELKSPMVISKQTQAVRVTVLVDRKFQVFSVSQSKFLLTSQRTCAGGNGCCGQRRSNTIYMNPDVVGCYEAPIPSASFVAGVPKQIYSEPTSGPTMVGHTITTASYAGPFVVATNPPSIPQFSIKHYNLGGWQWTSATVPIISGPFEPIIDNIFMTIDSCLNICFLVGYSYASLTNETTNGLKVQIIPPVTAAYLLS